MVAYSHYEEGRLQCEKHVSVEDKVLLAQFKKAKPRRP
jgi:hypothetical protein